ncbi:MAG TPA: hypothetical protein VF179_29970 [Thermoanaerobaculia bacterium]|nr:hypothetical protein [Thermoanaerobaculia bacterium]
MACLVDLSTATMASTTVFPDPGAAGREYFLAACHSLRLEALYDTGRPLTYLPLELRTTPGLPRTETLTPGRPDRLLLLMGGGKDSLYCYRLLRRAGYEVQCFYLTEARRTWQQLRRVYEHLAQETRQHRAFLDVNRRGALEQSFGQWYLSQFQIGQVVAAALPYALAHRCRHLVLGIERSSDEAMTTYCGEPVNHQHQKSTDFIRALNLHLKRRFGAGLSLVSPVKGLYDLGIYARFLETAQDLVPLQSSCGGANFHRPHCGRCPKCAFLAALLAGLTGDRDLYKRLFPRDPLQDPRLFADWLGPGSDRPLTCAGLKEEVQLGLRLARSRGLQIKWLGRMAGTREESWPDKTHLRHLLAVHSNTMAPSQLIHRIAPLLDYDETALLQLLTA